MPSARQVQRQEKGEAFQRGGRQRRRRREREGAQGMAGAGGAERQDLLEEAEAAGADCEGV